jgi:hypothetical protein
VEDDVKKSRLDDGTVLVGFELPAAVEATSVTVCGDFNDWAPGADPLSRSEDGRFRTELTLPAGRRWRFRYLLDGERWENDWAADDYVPNGLGQDDSVVDLTDASAFPTTGSSASTDDAAVVNGSAVNGSAVNGSAVDDSTADGSVVDDRSTSAAGSRGRLIRWWRKVTGRQATSSSADGASEGTDTADGASEGTDTADVSSSRRDHAPVG